MRYIYIADINCSVIIIYATDIIFLFVVVVIVVITVIDSILNVILI